jgi:hypothetical protein
MATNRLPDPIEEEGVRLLKENPELLASLEEIERRLQSGQYVPRNNHNEARRIAGLNPLPD